MSRRVVVASVVAAALVVGAVGFMRYRPTDPLEHAANTSKPEITKAVAAAKAFLDEYVDEDGRVVRRDQGGDTVSEGQAYAMLLSVVTGDRARFENVFSWADSNLRRSDGLFSWSWKNGSIVDEQSATDADLDIATALILASKRFRETNFEQEAGRIAKSILEKETVEGRGGRLLVAGPWATKSPFVVNPSYMTPKEFDVIARSTGDTRWSDVTNASRYVLGSFSKQPPGLPPDWAEVTADGDVRPTGPPDSGQSPTYGWDAGRVMVKMAEDCNEFGRRFASSTWTFFKDHKDKVAAIYDLEGHPKADYESPLSLIAAASAAHAARDHKSAEDLFARAEKIDREHPTYYGSAWIALGRAKLFTSLLGTC